MVDKSLKKNKGARFARLSFWVIMLIHLVVFTAIGLCTTRGWSLLVTFLIGLAVTLGLGALLKRYSDKHPEKRALRKLLNPGKTRYKDDDQ